MTEYNNLSESELLSVINEAEKALKDKQQKKHKEVVAQIKELAASIGVAVEINEIENKSTKKGKKVAAKYSNPNDPGITWTGRGVAPKWMQELINAGHNKSEYLIK